MFRKVTFGLILLFAATAVIVPMGTEACSLAVMKSSSSLLVARTMDWETPDGYVVKNYPGTSKTAQLILFNPYKWTSKYGSITLNLIQDIPLIGQKDAAGCGLNEKGLYAAELWVTAPPAVDYPANYLKPWLTTAEVVQVLLDNCATVDEAITQFKKVSLEAFSILALFDSSLDLHYFVADSTGKTAILEYANAVLKIYYPPTYPVMTNNFRDVSYAELARYQGFGGTLPVPETVPFSQRTSLTRFVLCVDSLIRLQNMGQVNVDAAFMLLERAASYNSPLTAGDSSGCTTVWSAVYDMWNRQITFTTSNNASRRVINLNGLTFPRRNTTAGKRIPIQSSYSGDITSLFLN
jgi:penicillin V acylase-like amidase (Ntn superfamily)